MIFRFDGDTVSVFFSTYSPHQYSSLGVFDNKPVAIGGQKSVDVEIFESDGWSITGTVPVFGTSYYYFSTVTMNGVLYTFGGYGYDKLVFKYDGVTWSEFDLLLWGRYGHRSVVMGNKIIHVGGPYTQ